MIAQAVRNLVDNAARFAMSTVRLSVSPITNGVRVTVEDDGPGIPAERRSEVFDRFVRLDEHRSRAGGGTGLGLAIVAEIARLHMGTVSVDTSLLGGAQVALTLLNISCLTGSIR